MSPFLVGLVAVVGQVTMFRWVRASRSLEVYVQKSFLSDVLLEQHVLVLPKIFTNAGGVTVFYFEWVQSMQKFTWTLEQMIDRPTRTCIVCSDG